MVSETFRLKVNGQLLEVEASADACLVDLLRDNLGLKGTRLGCGAGDCGGCMVLIDGRPENSCQVTVKSIGDRRIETIEGLLGERDLSPVGQPGQCGCCLSGVLVAATALLRANPSPTEGEVREALDGNLCRCGFFTAMVRGVLRASAVPAA